MNQSKKMQFIAAAHSDVGNLRKINQDSFCVLQNENLIIVCDGMGGSKAGGLASKIAVETIKDIFINFEQEQLNKVFPDLDETVSLSARRLIAAIRLANRRIVKLAIKFPKLKGMGTTVAALTFDESLAIMAHVGDSRILRVSEGEILQLTEDHSWLNELLADNEINEDEIETFAQRNVITRALGTSSTVEIDIHCEKYKKGDIYILCTDGLHNSVSVEEINNLIQKNNETLEKLTRTLTEIAKTRDGTDNITVAIANIQQNSSDDQVMGISTTIAEEDEKNHMKEDKLIQERYDEPEMKLKKKWHMSAKTHRNLTVAGFVLFTLILGFFLGQISSHRKLNSNTHITPYLLANNKTQTEEAIASKKEEDKIVASKSLESLAESKTELTPFPAIQRSKVSSDAVLAFVFFNSLKDYEGAFLDKRGVIMDTLYPYLNVKIKNIEGNLSIFLLDESNNVIHQFSGIQLPPISEDSP